MATHKTQAELDAAVLASAERITQVREAGKNKIGDDEWWEALTDNDRAVRARREAMRPTKLELLAGAVYGRCSTLTDSEAKRLYREHYSTEGSVLYRDIRNLLARILAAPDEPTENS